MPKIISGSWFRFSVFAFCAFDLFGIWKLAFGFSSHYTPIMRVLQPTDEALAQATDIIRSGGVIVHATETCYGLACDLANAEAVKKLFAIKRRPTTQPVSALFPTVDEAKRWVEWKPRADELANQYLPGPLTLILPMREDAPARLFPTPAGGVTVGIRVSSHPLAQKLAALAGRPISTTSANVHGEANPYGATEVHERFSREDMKPDLILDSGELPAVPPSTVIDLTGHGGVKRQGTIEAR
jgi:L-threonylcarbamoyladenylate synthase